MKAGSTGLSTGPHLHFEVRINGVAVDSLPYITGESTVNTKNNTTSDTENNTTNNTENNITTNNRIN